MSEKDKLGDTLKKKEKAEEDRYFAKQDEERLAKLREDASAKEMAGLLGRCPRCPAQLTQVKVEGVSIDRCPEGCGDWLDAGELETITDRVRHAWLSRLFKRK